MGRGAAAAAPHDVLIWAAPHPRRIFCDPAAQGLWICHCEAPTGPWRPEREARGSALGVQSREGTRSLYRPPLKWYAPITSVAALTAQPLAALPPYGCGVPFTGVERHAHPRITECPRRPHAPCRGGDSPARRCTGARNRLSLNGKRQRFVIARRRSRRGNLGKALPSYTRHCRGEACLARRCTNDSNRPPLKWYAPIASVAALTAQSLAALPPYGCGVPFTGVERLV